jgi:2OG-Fe(II) oxygenase superfamily
MSLDSEYRYRDAPNGTQWGFNAVIQTIKDRAEKWYLRESGRLVDFNVCLLNFYENGQQRIGWHSDREEIGRDTPVASISLGATRSFCIRAKQDGFRDQYKLELISGSMVIMESICQNLYLHSVPKQAEVTEGRINLTFRCKTETTPGELDHERHDNGLRDIIGGTEPKMTIWTAEDSYEDEYVFGDDAKYTNVDHPIQFIIRTNIGAEFATTSGTLSQDHCLWMVLSLAQHQQQKISSLQPIKFCSN